MNKIYAKLFFVALISSCAYKESQLQKEWPIHPIGNGNGTINYRISPVQEGCVVMKNGDTLKGRIKLIPYLANSPNSNHIPVLPIGKTKASDIIEIDKKSINYIRVNEPLPSNNQNFTDFVDVGDKDLKRLVGRKNDVSIYDNVFSINPSNNSYGDKMILMTRKEKVTIYSTWFKKHFKKPLMRFINKRYKVYLKEENFKDEKAMIDYILDKENEQQEEHKNK